MSFILHWGLFKIFFSGTKRPMTLKVGMQHRGHRYYQVCSNYDPGLTLTYSTARSNLGWGTKICSNGLGHMTNMAAMHIYVKNLKNAYSLKPKDR